MLQLMKGQGQLSCSLHPIFLPVSGGEGKGVAHVYIVMSYLTEKSVTSRQTTVSLFGPSTLIFVFVLAL